MRTVFLRLLDYSDKATALRAMIGGPSTAHGKARFEVDPRTFSAVPRSPFAYWISDRVRRTFLDLGPFEGGGRTAKQGLATADDFRFVRAWWAVHPRDVGATWTPFTKGGRFSPYYTDVSLVVRWTHGIEEGHELKAFAETTTGTTHWSRRIASSEYYLRPGLTWPLRGARFSAQAVPPGCIFSVGGKMAFADVADLPWLLALFNSTPFDRLIAVFAGNVGGVQYEVGLIQSVPVPVVSPDAAAGIAQLANRAWSLKYQLDTVTETSHAFSLPALLQVTGGSFFDRADSWLQRMRGLEAEIDAIQSIVDGIFFELYGIEADERIGIIEGFRSSDTGVEPLVTQEDSDIDLGNHGTERSNADAVVLATELISWVVGVALGRFDIRLALGGRVIPVEPEPFDPLPGCAPGMLASGDGFALSSNVIDYPVLFPSNWIFVDDSGHASDLTASVRRVFDLLFEDSDARWREIATLLDPANHDLRSWLASGLFEFHIKRYSKSRRKAPILWQLATPSTRYAIWLYALRLTHDTFFHLQNEVLVPKLALEERRLLSLTQDAGINPALRQRSDLAEQESFVEELRSLRDEVARVAPLWNPDLDDGVVITMAPLWRLVPQNRAWQRELKAAWDALAAGKYDWAHLAMHLWPERVVPKCAEDRSLAIAHGLEDVFWEENTNGKWNRRAAPTHAVEELVRERTSAEVMAALKNLMDAPLTGAAGGQGRSARNGRGRGGR